MNEGVKVLIERMKTNPEDFQMHPISQGVKRGRFYWVTEEMQKFLPMQGGHYYLTLLKKDDLDALVDAFKDMHQQEFTDKVMKDLFREDEELKVSPQIAGGWLPQGQRVNPLQNSIGTWTDPRSMLMQQPQIDSTSGLTSVSLGTGTTASSWFNGLFK